MILSKDVARFWSNVERSDDCWLWTASKSSSGYGRFELGGKSRIASRIAYEIAYGISPVGMCVMHKCDNPACVNPRHLILGTHRDNMQDRNRKGRARGGKLVGEHHPRAKLTNLQVGEIKLAALRGDLSQKIIAKQYGISQTRVSEIKNGTL